MSWFSFQRSEGFPTQYEPNATSVTADILEVGLLAALIIALLTFAFVFVPSRRWKTNSPVAIRATVSLTTGFFILYGNFGQEWEVGSVTTTTPYKSGSSAEINASIELKIGLRGVNITLRNISQLSNQLAKETVDYNERFEWRWDQGRIGFGPYAGLFQREFREAQYHGTPTPILWVAEYFVIDGEGFRFGRFYRTAGWYTHIALWAAFPCWIIANVLFGSLISHGAYFLAGAGGLQLFGVFLWSVVRNFNELCIPFADGIIATKYGITYWLTFASGLFSVALSGIILLLDYKYEAWVHSFFNVDLLHTYSEVYLSRMEIEQLQDGIYDMVVPTPIMEPDKPIFLKRRSTIVTKAPPKISKKQIRANLLAHEIEMSNLSPQMSTRTGLM